MKRSARKFFIYGDIVLLLLIPFAIIALHRYERSPTPRLAIIQDMDQMPYRKPQRPSPLFADGRAMRPHIPGTMAREDFVFLNTAEARAHPNNWKKDHVVINSGQKYDRIMLGQVISGGKARFISHIPIPITRRFLEPGRGKFDIYCTPCHGYDGRGNGTINRYVNRLRAAGSPDAGTWVQPTDLTGPGVQYLPAGGLYNVITNGIAAMASYKDQIPVVDRWAIVAYVKALALSQKVVPVDRLPPPVRAKLGAVPAAKVGK